MILDFSKLKTDFPDQGSRIGDDPQGKSVTISGSTLHARYQSHIAALTDFVTETELSAAHDGFCMVHACAGHAIHPSPDERFGHVMSMNSFRRFVAKPGVSTSGMPPRSGMLGPMPTKPLSSAEANGILLTRLEDEMVRPPDSTMWCFRSNASPTDPLDDVDPALLPCRLGLKRSQEASGSDTTWIAFRVEPPPTEWRRPTFADATWRFLTDWQPGGLTVSSPEYACGLGLPEAIGRGVKYGQMTLGAGPFTALWPTP